MRYFHENFFRKITGAISKGDRAISIRRKDLATLKDARATRFSSFFLDFGVVRGTGGRESFSHGRK